MVEVDHAATLNNLPDVPGVPAANQTQTGRLNVVLDGASKVFSNAERGAGIYMYYLFDQTNLDLPKASVDTFDKIAATLRDTRNVQLQSDLMHLLFVDEGV
ncbi:MAG: hypothetical protein K2V38_20350, partial [Gemmataceae bacterium]|nr:hypothetical protein [Gemmataceae bacterium]